ncbi:MAG TPA: hypothetical protein VJ302_37885 [Blastocatellia bacterium]|nr:hypothetical protein [Blastocatellia bacterium]
MSQFGYPNPRAIPQRGPVQTNPPSAVKTIPFDYVFQFSLLGRRGNKVQDVVEISTEGVFVALSVGYSLSLNEKDVARTFQPVLDQNTLLRAPLFIPLFTNNDLSRLFIIGSPDAEIVVVLLNPSGTIVVEAAAVPAPAPQILAGGTLGSDGTLLLNLEPLVSGSQILVRDRTNNLVSQTMETGTSSNNATRVTPVIGQDPTTGLLPAIGETRVNLYGSNHEVTLTVLRGNSNTPLQQATVTLNRLDPSPAFAGGADVFSARVDLTSPLSPDDLLLVSPSDPTLLGAAFNVFNVPRVRLANIPLGALAAGLERNGVDLTQGFRLSADTNRLVAANPAVDEVAASTLARIFETGAVAAAEVSFLYSLDSFGAGRDYQSKPIHNIAGLGIADGDRPFRPFAKPVLFEPKSSIRIQVEELSGPAGTLSIVLQGYKLLGAGRLSG